jgi:hypothetical protein
MTFHASSPILSSGSALTAYTLQGCRRFSLAFLFAHEDDKAEGTKMSSHLFFLLEVVGPCLVEEAVKLSCALTCVISPMYYICYVLYLLVIVY